MRNLKRALSLGLTAAMISGLMIMGSSAAGYADVTSEQNQEAIEVLQAVGIMVGDESGNFNPDATVSRNEMAVVMSNLMEYNVATYANTSPFTDVPEWAEPYVAACWTNGITAGYSDTTYGGSDTVTTAQAALMLMKALGYFQYQQDFGSDWQLATISKGNDIDLFTDVDSGVREAMTRNDLAQLVLNTLEAGTVQASTNGSFTVGDVTVATSVEYNYVTSTRAYASAISGSASTTDQTDAGASIVELGERLYEGDLEKDGDAQDDFGRPATIWSYQNDEIGTYLDGTASEWTTKVEERDLYAAAGSTAVSNYDWYVYVDGVEVEFDPDDLSRSSDDRVLRSGNGVLTQCFVDKDAGPHGEVIVSLINTYVAEVDNVEDNGDDYTVTVSYDTYPSDVSLDREFDTEDTFEKDDVVIVTVANGEIKSMAIPETVQGTVSAVKNNDYLRMDGTTYNYNYGYTGGTGSILTGVYDLDDNGGTNPEAGDDVTIYLDANGAVVAIEGADVTADDYLYVTGINEAYGDVSAKVVFSDGTEEIIDIDEVNGDDAVAGSMTNYDTGYTYDTHQVIPNMVYKFSQSGSSYDLTTVASNGSVDNVEDRTASWTEKDSANGYRSEEAIVLENSTASFSFYTVDYTDPTDPETTTTATENFVANSNTVFVDVDNNRAFIGYRNVPGMTSVDGGFVVEKDGVAEIVFLTDAGSYSVDDDSFFFVKKTSDVTVEDTEDGDRYDWTVYVNGAEETLSLTEGASKGTNGITEVGLYKIESTDNNDWVDEVKLLVTKDMLNAADPDAAYATYAEDELLRLADNDGDSTTDNGYLVTEYDSNANRRSSFAYDGDTVFMVVELDASGNPDKIRTGRVSDIETYEAAGDNSDLTAVYVANVEDKDDATPKATLVLVVKPYINTRTASYTVTYPDGVTVKAGSSSVASGSEVRNGTDLTITATPEAGMVAEIYVNGTLKGTNSVSSYTVNGNDVVITVTQVTDPDTVGTITVDAPAGVYVTVDGIDGVYFDGDVIEDLTVSSSSRIVTVYNAASGAGLEVTYAGNTLTGIGTDSEGGQRYAMRIASGDQTLEITATFTVSVQLAGSTAFTENDLADEYKSFTVEAGDDKEITIKYDGMSSWNTGNYLAQVDVSHTGTATIVQESAADLVAAEAIEADADGEGWTLVLNVNDVQSNVEITVTYGA